ncbi:TPA: hypothetical protein EYN23_18095 [Candidatus Poribacteria bacterium]|nr:hypothetical protein [Candidatus Poribacteria bacterium]
MKLIKELPNPFLMKDGSRVVTEEDWNQRRQEIKDMMINIQYGSIPSSPEEVKIKHLESKMLDGGETQEELYFEFVPKRDQPEIKFGMNVTVLFPSLEAVKKRKMSVEGFGRNGIPALIYVGKSVFHDLLQSGYMMICYENNQLEPIEMGNPIVGPVRQAYEKLEPGKYSWGSISVWAWGALQLLEYILTLASVDKKQIMISGHSRNGKTALLAGALDDRIAIVNPAGSGCAGAGSYLALGDDCEDLAALTDRKRWWTWTHPDFEKWAGHEKDLPFDQHFLMGLVAPRPLLRTEGRDDLWANPEGTYASFSATQPIYDFLGVPERNGIHIREGGHYQGEEDSGALLAFADWHFFNLSPKHCFKGLLQEGMEFPTFFRWTHPK